MVKWCFILEEIKNRRGQLLFALYTGSLVGLTGGVLAAETLHVFWGTPVGTALLRACPVMFILFSIAGWVEWPKLQKEKELKKEG
mgnify:CR=1 FL=1